MKKEMQYNKTLIQTKQECKITQISKLQNKMKRIKQKQATFKTKATNRMP